MRCSAAVTRGRLTLEPFGITGLACLSEDPTPGERAVSKSISVAIVGAGPAGFYTAEALLRHGRNVHVDLIEKLPTPHGLIRAGVAPDHQSTKQVARRFEKTAAEDAVRYYGNVDVGTDVGVSELTSMYDAVVLAVGAPLDRPLGIPGDDKAGVYGSAQFVGWYNGHPDFQDLDPALDGPAAVVVGVGNVALDVARVLVKTQEEMAASDIPDPVGESIARSSVTDIFVLGRRSPLESRFTNVELREMADLAKAVPLVSPVDLPDHNEVSTIEDDRERRLQAKNIATLRAFAANRPEAKPKRVRFRFFSAPVEILGGKQVEAVRVERTQVVEGRAVGTGEFETIPCGLVVSAIGYRSLPIPNVPYDADRGLVPNCRGRIAPGLYAVGWAKRGPSGVIASNRADGVLCAEQIESDIGSGTAEGRSAFERVLRERGVRAVTFEDWMRINTAEIAAAQGKRPRRKFTTLGEMLAVLGR